MMADKEEELVTDHEKVLLEMTLETRPPANEYERELLAEIRAIKANGQMVDIPAEIR